MVFFQKKKMKEIFEMLTARQIRVVPSHVLLVKKIAVGVSVLFVGSLIN